jgi:hypothetical protein
LLSKPKCQKISEEKIHQLNVAKQQQEIFISSNRNQDGACIFKIPC